jgi:hypothetical protein
MTSNNNTLFQSYELAQASDLIVRAKTDITNALSAGRVLPRTYLPVIDEPMTGMPNMPFFGAQLCLVVGSTNHGKTPLLTYMATRYARDIVASSAWQNSERRGRILYFALEDYVESMRMRFARSGNLHLTAITNPMMSAAQIRHVLSESDDLPIVVCGSSIADSDAKLSLTEFGSSSPTVSKIARTIATLYHAHKIMPIAVYIDHFHLLSTEKKHSGINERYERVGEEIVELISWLRDVPLFVGAQANVKDIANRPAKKRQPDAQDMRYGSAALDYARDVITVWRPANDGLDDAETLEIVQRGKNKITVPTHPSFLFVKSAKARFAPIVGVIDVLSLGGYLPNSRHGDVTPIEFSSVEF